MREYEEGGLRSYVPFCTTGRGVHLRGEVKGLKPEALGKPTVRSISSSGVRDEI